jgi:hypothetical protein
MIYPSGYVAMMIAILSLSLGAAALIEHKKVKFPTSKLICDIPIHLVTRNSDCRCLAI